MSGGRCWIQRASVALLLLVSLAAGTIALPHSDGADDAACSPVAVAHDQSAHHIGAAENAAPTEPAHCLLCHCLRTYHHAFDRFHQPRHTVRTERLHFAAIDRPSVVAWALVPGRAPPV